MCSSDLAAAAEQGGEHEHERGDEQGPPDHVVGDPALVVLGQTDAYVVRGEVHAALLAHGLPASSAAEAAWYR